MVHELVNLDLIQSHKAATVPHNTFQAIIR